MIFNLLIFCSSCITEKELVHTFLSQRSCVREPYLSNYLEHNRLRSETFSRTTSGSSILLLPASVGWLGGGGRVIKFNGWLQTASLKVKDYYIPLKPLIKFKKEKCTNFDALFILILVVVKVVVNYHHL